MENHNYLNCVNTNTYKPNVCFKTFMNNIPEIKNKILKEKYFISRCEELEKMYLWAKKHGFEDYEISVGYNQHGNPKIQVYIMCNKKGCETHLWSMLQHHFPKDKNDIEGYRLSNQKCIQHQGRGLPLWPEQKELLRPYNNRCVICNNNNLEDFHHIRPYANFRNEFKDKIFDSPINSFAYKTTTINNVANQLWICKECHKMLTFFQRKEKNLGIKYYSDLIPELHLINAYLLKKNKHIYYVSYNLYNKITKLYNELKGEN